MLPTQVQLTGLATGNLFWLGRGNAKIRTPIMKRPWHRLRRRGCSFQICETLACHTTGYGATELDFHFGCFHPKAPPKRDSPGLAASGDLSFKSSIVSRNLLPH